MNELPGAYTYLDLDKMRDKLRKKPNKWRAVTEGDSPRMRGLVSSWNHRPPRAFKADDGSYRFASRVTQRGSGIVTIYGQFIPTEISPTK